MMSLNVALIWVKVAWKHVSAASSKQLKAIFSCVSLSDKFVISSSVHCTFIHLSLSSSPWASYDCIIYFCHEGGDLRFTVKELGYDIVLIFIMLDTVTTEEVSSISEALCTCSNEVGLAVGILILIEGVIAIVTATAVAVFWLIKR